MFYFFMFLTAAAAFVSGQGCDKHGILVYEDLGCTAEFGNETKCPVKYSCQGLEASNKTCYFRGRSYDVSEEVEDDLSYPSCNVGCRCIVENGRSSFFCAALDCAEWLGDPIKPGCFRKYRLGACCSVGKTCPPFDNIQKCVVEGKEYREGQRFAPSNTCLRCVCQKAFKGKFEEPFCRKKSCGEQLQLSGYKIQEFCAPFYSKQFHSEAICCPDDWICPQGTETVKGDAKSEETCKFGSKTLKVGQQFERFNFTDGYGRRFEKVKCECVIPPFVKCRDV